MHRLQPEIGQRQLLAARKLAKTYGLKWPAGFSGAQPGPTIWPGCTMVAGKAAAAGLIEQEGLDRRLLDAVLAERPARGGLGGRDRDGMAVHPDRAAVEEVLHLAAQRLDQVLGARQA